LDAGATWGWSLEALSQSWVKLNLEDRVLSLYGLAKGAHFQHFGEFNSAFVADGKNWPTPDRALQTLSSEDTSGNEAFDPKSDLDVAGAVNTLSNWALLTKLCSITAEQAAALEKSLTPLGVLSPPATRFQTKSRAWRGQTESGSVVRCLGSMTFSDKILSFVNVSGEPASGERITINGQDVGHLACTLWKMNDHWAYLQPEEQRSISLVLT